MTSLIQPVETRLLDQYGKPIPRRLFWTSVAWRDQLRRHGMFTDLNRMERAQSKRDRKRQARKAVLA